MSHWKGRKFYVARDMSPSRFRLYHAFYFEIDMSMYAAMSTKAIAVNGSIDITFSLYDNSFTMYASWTVYYDKITNTLRALWVPNYLEPDLDPQMACQGTMKQISTDGTIEKQSNFMFYDHYDQNGFEGLLWQFVDLHDYPDGIIISGRLRYALPDVSNCPIMFMIDMPASYYQQVTQ